MEDYHRYDISDETWEKIKDKLPGRRGMWGGIATRYAKNASSFLAAIHVRCIALALSYL